MITRRRGRSVKNTEEEQCVEVEVTAADKALQSPYDRFPSDDTDTTGMELEDLLGIEDLDWTLERDGTSPLFDIELADLGICSANDQDSSFEASVASSPERMPSDLKMKNRKNQPSHVINKNAIAARLNRLKKKEYVNSLERKVGVLSAENGGLKQENAQLTKRVEELEDETRASTQMTTTMPYPGSV
ncbi:uncharacterized protein V6R79_024956 [Siganus canaliculatus]